MKGFFFILLFFCVFGVSFYFFSMNSSQEVELIFWEGVKTPPVPVGLAVLMAFFLGIVVGMLLFALTYVIKRVSS